MTQAVNMAGSSIYTLLAIIAIVAQSCLLTNARDSGHSYPRRHGGNANINTNINTFHKSRRLYETSARSSPEKKDEKAQIGKDMQTAIIATAAADAAKAATRMVVKKFGENTADAVASAVVRALSGEDGIDNKTGNITEEKAIKVAERATQYLHEALNRLLYRNEKKSAAVASRKSLTILPPYTVKKRQEDGDSSEEEEQEEEDGDESLPPGDSDEEEHEVEPDARQSKAHMKNRLHRRFLDHPDAWKNHYRRSADVKPGISRDNKP